MILSQTAITSAVTNIEPADRTMLPSFSDNSSAQRKAASDSTPACHRFMNLSVSLLPRAAYLAGKGDAAGR